MFNSQIYSYTIILPLNRQRAFLSLLLKSLDHVSGLEAFPAFESHTTLRTPAHLLNILFDVLETGHDTCKFKVSNDFLCISLTRTGQDSPS